MSRYVAKRIRTSLTTHHGWRPTRALVGVSATLLLGSCALLSGLKQDCVLTACPETPSTVVLQEPIQNDWQSTHEASIDSCRPEPNFECECGCECEAIAKYSSHEVTLVAKTVWGEARGCSRDEQKLVVWCICNRADARNQSVEEVVTATNQFVGYDHDHPVEAEIVEVVEEVLHAWSCNEEALILPPYATTSNYQYFSGDGKHNWFREEY